MRWTPAATGGEEVPLTGIRAEFRTALLEEIKTASRHASADAVSLIGGRRIAQIGSAVQYIFSVENPLNLPSDTPADLHVPGFPTLSATVVSVEGLSVTLSVPQDLGQFVPAARLVSDLTFLMRRLVARIEMLADGPNPVGDRMLGLSPVAGSPDEADRLDDKLNDGQKDAVASSLGRNATFIWGPPGTGKTTTIGAISHELFCRNRSVLLVSHTNIAVDQAVLSVGGKVPPSDLAEGRVVRVGEPQDQQLLGQPDLLLETHVKRRSEALAQQRDTLQAERANGVAEVLRLSRLIDMCEWVGEASADIDSMERLLDDVRGMEDELAEAQRDESSLAASSNWWRDAATAAAKAKQFGSELPAAQAKAAKAQEVFSALDQKRIAAEGSLAEAVWVRSLAESLAPTRARLRELPPLDTQTQEVDIAQRAAAEARRECEVAAAMLADAEALLARTSSVGALTRLWRKLPDPEVQRGVVEELRNRSRSAVTRRDSAHAGLAASEALLKEVAGLTEELRPFAGIPDLETQEQIVGGLRGQLAFIHAEIDQSRRTLEAGDAEVTRLLQALDAFGREYGGAPEEVAQQAQEHASKLARARALVREFRRKSEECRADLETVARSRLSALREWGLTSEPDGAAEAMIKAIQDAHSMALAEVEGLELAGLRAQRGQLNQRIEAIDKEVASIEDARRRVEELVIADAGIVATTLTRAYLRDDIQSRQFDTVILDEASIAPIPALWIAASRAEQNAVVVGDWKQLPPIVLSDHELAERWLGRQIFDVANIGETTPRLVKLRLQYRMHPDVSAIPNALVYDGILDNHKSCEDDGCLSEWYSGHPDPVLLVDTGSLGAWVTSVPRGDSASRLNFLSASVCVDIAERLLRPGVEPPAGGGHRVLIVCPYRAHAKLLGLLLREQGLTDHVEAGTAHSFQGTEADVVIFDLVNDEPHRRVGMFIPKHDGKVRPLLNVALTRARRRLVIVGDFDYITKLGGKAFVGARLLPFLRQQGYARVDASEIVPTGLSVRAARAQAAVMESADEAEIDRRICRGEEFYLHFARDLLEARSRAVVYSAFITRSRLAMLEPPLKAAVDRGRRVYVVTRAHSDRRRRELPEYRMLERALRDWGVTIVHKQNMHEKLIFIDDDVIWAGSMNALSSTGETGEHMERRRNPRLYQEYAQAVFLGQLVGPCAEGNPACPVCGCEIVAAEGLRKPFYWFCTNKDCGYKRDADAPAPENGLIACSNCGGEVEYGEWGGKPAWRCTVNSRHHQRVAPAHLRLPRMRELVPKHILRELDRRYGTARQPSAKTMQGKLNLNLTDTAPENGI